MIEIPILLFYQNTYIDQIFVLSILKFSLVLYIYYCNGNQQNQDCFLINTTLNMSYDMLIYFNLKQFKIGNAMSFQGPRYLPVKKLLIID